MGNKTAPTMGGNAETLPDTNKNEEPAKKKKVLLWDPKVFDDKLKFTPEMCPAVDQAMFYENPPSPLLRAADYWCRAERWKNSTPATATADTSLPKIPIVVQQDDGKVFFGLIDRDDLNNAEDACKAISAALPSIMPTDPDAVIMSVVSMSGCKSISEQLAADNPMVVLATTNVIATGLVNDFSQLLQDNPDLAPVGKLLQGINEKISDTVRDAVKKPIDWAIANPNDALKMLQPTLSMIGDAQAKQVAELTLSVFKAGNVLPDQLMQAANNLAGPAAQVIKDAAQIIAAPNVGQAGSAVEQAVDNTRKEAEKVLESVGIDPKKPFG